VIEPFLPEVDQEVLLSVNPGIAGKFSIELFFCRVQQLAESRARIGADFLIEIDGGVGPDNITRLVSAGADILVAGSSVFGAKDIPARIRELNIAMLHGLESPRA
jgi:ribulose-phosphate 3-epimerase